MRNVTNMLKEENEIKWIVDARKSFKDIKKDIIEALVLASLDFTKGFMAFSYAYNHTIDGVLLQKNSQNGEQPIASSTRC